MRAGAASLCFMGLLAPRAHADEVYGTRSSLLQEKRHTIEATLHRGHARWVVRRTVFNGGERHDQAMFFIDAPPGAVATGLRTLGTLNGRPQWFDGELMEAEEAARKYQELTGIGGYYPKDPALLSWRSQQRLALQVFPCSPSADKTIEYTFDMPVPYAGGAYRLPFPAVGTEQRLASVVVRAGSPADRLLVDGKPTPSGTAVQLRRDETVEVFLVPAQAPMMEGELAVVPFASRRVLTHYHVSAAPRLSTVPSRAQVVVVVDASKSATDSIEAFRDAAIGYLGHFPDAHVQLLFFDRKPRSHFPAFTPGREVLRELEGMRIDTRNGSNVEDAIAEAERLLSGRPGAATAKRIVVITDGLTRSSLAPGRIRGAIGASGAIVHVGITHGGWPSVERNDQHPWADAVRSSGGLVWQTAAGTQDPPTRHAAFESWARPTQIDHVRLVGAGLAWGEAPSTPPSSIEEGEGFGATVVTSSALAHLRVEGEMWARPVQISLSPSVNAAKRWAALVFGSDLLSDLSEAEMMTLARKGGAVSPVTSFLAIEPGVRPSTEGLDAAESGSFGAGAPRVRVGATLVHNTVPYVDREQFLRDAIRSAMRSCGLRSRTASAVIETTRVEVVDVVDVTLEGPADPIGTHCLREAIWGFHLPLAFREDWDSWSVRVEPQPAPAPPTPPTLFRSSP
jgi:hypothetical protein